MEILCVFLRSKKHTHIREKEDDFNIKTCHKFHLKAIITFKGWWDNVYYI